jgi:hypothetical protein
MDLKDLRKNYPFHMLTGAILAGMALFAIARTLL